ncbi:calcineurin-like phosphoesterase family protein [Paenibacillus sp. BK033]|uniref:S-layer homology domain-containing protein n=1 Tax=Paenibacillus sp. BK033 TaxID=2512133 RepID=UPI00104A52E6|nr:S-layer homology domain-containing protein [Paenibacillus sp. BK033]TCM99098.1 calcineurin-like phosphoesterase family protein [Paenibacillus sp. BK033]
MRRFIRNKKLPAMVLALATVLNLSNIGAFTANAAPPGVNVLKSEKISSGVHFTSEEYSNYYKENNRVVVNRLDINPADSNTRIITAKAYDTISAVETIGDQANREMLKGNQVIAGIDGDFYDIDPASGSPLGLMMKDGELIISQAPDENATNYRTSFYMDNANKPGINQIHAEGKISVAGAQYDVNLLNRNQKVTNGLVIHTSKITKTRKMTHNYAADRGKSAFALIRVNGNFDGVHPGQDYTGTVVNVTSTEGFDIPDDSVVLEGVGTSKPIVEALQTNAEVSFKYDLYAGKDANNNDRMNNDIVTSITFNTWLVRDGVALSTGDTAPNAHTALGMKADGSLIAVTVDKPSSSYTGSIGTSLDDLAKYLQEAGAVNALNLDGGGSTEMIVRQAGSDRPVTISHPGDVNGSRLVSSSLLFVSTATKGATVGNVVVDKNVTLYTGSKYDFSYRLADEFGNPISSGNGPAAWASTIGSVDPAGHYVANAGIGAGEVTATVDGVKGSAKVTVVDTVNNAAFTSNNVVMMNNEKKQFGFTAVDGSGNQVYIDPSVATWSLSGGIGDVDASGLVTTNENGGTGTLTATFGSYTITTNVTVGPKEQIIDNFDTVSDSVGIHPSNYPIQGYHYSGTAYPANTNAASSPYFSFSTTIKHSGDRSFKMDYDMANWSKAANGTLNWIPHWYKSPNWSDDLADSMDKSYKTDIYPKKFGIWVYGDGKAPWLRVIFKDGTNTNKTLDLTTETQDIDWVGWKYLELNIPQGWALPIRLNYVYMAETTKTKPNYSGSIYFDDMKFIYTDDVQDISGPVFTNTLPSSDGWFDSTLDFSTTITDNLSGVKEDSIIVKVNDAPQTYTYDKDTGRLSFKLENLVQGDYRVYVEAKDGAGNQSVPWIDKTYHVDLTPDEEAPTMTDVTPTKDVKVKIPTPRVTFKLLDSKSQVDPASISVRMNDIELPVYYDANTGWGYAEPASNLANGDYTLSINARDNAGNAMPTYKDELTLEAVAQPADGHNFSISVIPDTQGNAFTQKLFSRAAADDTSLVMHMGDIVDDGSQLQYDQADDFTKLFGAKPFFVLAGNHEAFKNTLDIFYKKFGSPTQHFEYGDTQIIMLNSAYIQSITESDSTQFHWLEDVLAKNTKKNVLVFDHVITRDSFGTAHQMDAEDAKRYESILGEYKKAHPDTEIYSLFGHLHTLQTWDVDGVKYIITGNGADKTYVSHGDGDMLGSGKITLTDGKMKFTYDPLLTKTYIKNEAIIGNKMSAVIGSKVQLDMFGDFREYPANYVTQINNHDLVGIKWSSSNEAVASVDENGAVTSKSSGSAVITGVSGGKASSVTVETVKPTDVTPVKLNLYVPESTQVGGTFIPTIKATNAYGAVYALDAKDVTFSFKNGKAHMQDAGVILADAEGDEEITVTFSGLKATAIAKIVAKPITPPAPDNGGPVATKPDVDLTKDSVVKAGVFAELAKDKNATMTFAGNGYKWKVIGADITNPNADADLGVNVKNQAPVGKVSTPVQLNRKKVVMGLSLNQNGALPGKMTLEIPTSKDQAGKKLFFYAVNSADQAPVLVSELTADENGNVAIPFTSSTSVEYVLTSQKILDFKDADAHWAKADIYYLVGKDMISGVNDSQFLPNNTITRGEFVKLIAGAAGADVSGFTNSSFADVRPDAWYSPYVEWAKKNSIVLGVKPNVFAPNEKISREQMAVILVRLSDLLGYTLETNAQPVHFKDEATISSYAREAVKKAQQAGIVSGMPNNQFSPEKSASRGEAAKMLATLLKAMEK